MSVSSLTLPSEHEACGRQVSIDTGLYHLRIRTHPATCGSRVLGPEASRTLGPAWLGCWGRWLSPSTRPPGGGALLGGDAPSFTVARTAQIGRGPLKQRCLERVLPPVVMRSRRRGPGAACFVMMPMAGGAAVAIHAPLRVVSTWHLEATYRSLKSQPQPNPSND